MCKQLVTSYTSVVLLSASLCEMIIIQMAGVESILMIFPGAPACCSVLRMLMLNEPGPLVV